jgi:hypothetical protein
VTFEHHCEERKSEASRLQADEEVCRTDLMTASGHFHDINEQFVMATDIRIPIEVPAKLEIVAILGPWASR